MTLADSWWATPQWIEYERICGVSLSRVDELRRAAWSTQVIDLTQTETDLWRGLRGSYKPLINKAQREYRVGASGADSRGLMPHCQEVHRIDAGRVTRPTASWDLMADWLTDGFAILASAWDSPPYPPERSAVAIGHRLAGFAYFLVHGSWSYYASAATLERNVNHALIWHGLKALKARGVSELEIGWQGYAHPDDAKQIGIEFFRRGFGGRTIPIQEYYSVNAQTEAC